MKDQIEQIKQTAIEEIKKSSDLKTLGETKVKFLGKIKPEKLRAITLQADVGLSIEENNGLSYYFSMPNKISDYIQARIPIVVSNFPEMRKVIDRYHVGEKIENYSQLPEKINAVLENGKKYYQEYLDDAANELCWENEAPKIIALFKKVESTTS